MPRPLSGRVAVVAGATRGGGRGIARMLGEAGAAVYCTERSSRERPNVSSHVHAGRPETIEETAEMVSADDHDQSVPTFASVRVLDSIRAAGNGRHTVVRYANANHALRDVPSGETAPVWDEMMNWLKQLGALDPHR